MSEIKNDFKVGDYVCLRDDSGFVEYEYLLLSEHRNEYFVMFNTKTYDLHMNPIEFVNSIYEYCGTRTRYNRFTEKQTENNLPI